MKQKSIRVIALLLAAVLFMALLSGCGRKSEIRKQIAAFEAGCRAGSLEQVLDCFDPQAVQPIKSALGFLGTDLTELSDLVYSVIGLGGLVSSDQNKAMEMLQSLQFKPTEYVFNDSKDRCDVTVVVSGASDGEPFEDEAVLHCVLRDGTWYLTLD